jgi:hypothetical protein
MVCITSSGETAATEAQREMMMDLSVGSAAAHKGLVNNNGKYKRNGRGRSREQVQHTEFARLKWMQQDGAVQHGREISSWNKQGNTMPALGRAGNARHPQGAIVNPC